MVSKPEQARVILTEEGSYEDYQELWLSLSKLPYEHISESLQFSLKDGKREVALPTHMRSPEYSLR